MGSDARASTAVLYPVRRLGDDSRILLYGRCLMTLFTQLFVHLRVLLATVSFVLPGLQRDLQELQGQILWAGSQQGVSVNHSAYFAQSKLVFICLVQS